MRFRKLTLRNFGAYYSEQEFRFDVINNSKNVVLIGGKNGAGKTTILEAIRIALYGSFAYGFKSESESYQRKIYSFLNKIALENNEGCYQVFLEFEYVEDLQKSVYVFKRQWYPTGHQVREEFSIVKDGLFIDDPKETDIVQTKINQVFPPKLFDLCLFDGETISRVITDDLIADYLREIANVLYNIDLFINLNKDIEALKNQLTRQHDPQLIMRYEQIVNEIEKNRARKEEFEKKINHLSSEIKEKQSEVDELKRQYSIYGGLRREERENLLNDIYALKQERKEISEKIKEYITGIFPLYIVRSELERVSVQMELEQQFDAYEYLSSKITPYHLGEIFQGLNLSSDLDIGEQGRNILEHILELIRPKGIKIIHRASFHQRSEVQFAINSIKEIDPDHVLNWFSRSRDLLIQIQNLRRKLEINDTNSEFQEITNQIQLLSEEVTAAKLKIEKLQHELELLDHALNELQKERDHLDLKISKVSKNQTTFKNIEKISNLGKKFIKFELADKLEKVQTHALLMFSQLLRKENYVKRIMINPDTFEIDIYSSNNTIIDKKMLSAGEKQILLLSLIWSIVKVSRRKIPFVFDTLLGRLDQSHKGNVLTKLIPNCGDQVIILSTDSEIDQKHLNLVLPYVSAIGTLVNDPLTKSAKYEMNKYFDLVTV